MCISNKLSIEYTAENQIITCCSGAGRLVNRHTNSKTTLIKEQLRRWWPDQFPHPHSSWLTPLSSSCSMTIDLQPKGVATPPESYRQVCCVGQSVTQASTPGNVEQAIIGQ